MMELENALYKFEEATGLVINYNKTCVYGIGSLKGTNARLYTRKPFAWTDGPVKILGILISHNKAQCFKNTMKFY